MGRTVKVERMSTEQTEYRRWLIDEAVRRA
jgi:hypothetical protein